MYDDSLAASPVVTGRWSARDDAGGDRGGEAQRRAERDHRVADVQRRGLAQRGGLHLLGLLAVEHREVVDRRAADDLGVVAVAVLVDDLDQPVVLRGLLDHVVVGDDVPARVDDEAGPGRAALLAVVLGRDLDGAGQQLLGHGGDRGLAALDRRGGLDTGLGQPRAACRRRRTPSASRRCGRRSRCRPRLRPRRAPGRAPRPPATSSRSARRGGRTEAAVGRAGRPTRAPSPASGWCRAAGTAADEEGGVHVGRGPAT